MQQPDTQKNLLIAIILSIAVLLGWQMLVGTPQPHREQAPPAPTDAIPSPGATPDAAAPAAPGTGAPSVPAAAPTREAALAASPRVAIDTPSVRGSIALKGGRIDDLILKHYRETVDPSSPNVVLLSPANGPDAYFAEHGWVAPGGTNLALPDRDTLWQVERHGPLTPANPVTLVWDNQQGLIFRRTISVDDRYMFKVTDWSRIGPGPTLPCIPTPGCAGGYAGSARFLHLARRSDRCVGDAGLHEITYSDALKADGSTTVNDANGGWLGITDKYWAATLIPNQNTAYNARMTGRPASAGQPEFYQADYMLPATVIPAGDNRASKACCLPARAKSGRCRTMPTPSASSSSTC